MEFLKKLGQKYQFQDRERRGGGEGGRSRVNKFETKWKKYEFDGVIIR